MRYIKGRSAVAIIVAAALMVAVTASAQEEDYSSFLQLPLAPSGTWVFTGSLHHAREEHVAIRLGTGKVIVAGGASSGTSLALTELYTPTTGTWANSGNLNVGRAAAAAVLLSSGEVLIAGGCTGTCLAATNTAELYNPTSGTWALTGSLTSARAFFTLTKLTDGRVLAAGGCPTLDVNGCTTVTSLAEIYNPSTGSWSSAGTMRTGRATHTATLLSTGRVLVAGGANAAGDALGSSELFTAPSGWALTGRMNAAHAEHTATMLTSGNVLVAGGENASGVSQVVTETYNPSTGAWTRKGNLNGARQEQTAVLLGNGKVLVAGGSLVTLTTTSVLATAELFTPGVGWSKTGNMKNARTGHTTTLLSNGLVLAAAGSGPVDELITAELYTP